MLNALRKRASGWVAQLFIALLVLSFAVWGVADIFTGFRGDTVATVGSTSVSSQKFYREYELAKRQFSARIQQPITDDQARIFGIQDQVLGRLVTEATLTDQADALGLGVSGDTLVQQIAGDPSFQGSNGTFDRSLFIQVVNNAGMSENQFVEELREGYVRQQLATALVGGVEVPDAYLRAFHDYQTEERDISYLVLSPAAAGAIADPTETELIAFFDGQKSDWRAPELRTVRVMSMTPQDLANTGEISDDEARTTYDAQVESRFTTPERRQVEQIVFDNAANAADAAAALADGTTFDDLVAAQGLNVSDIGLVTRAEMRDQATADAAFALESGAVSGIVEGRFGPVIVRVTAIEPAVVRPFNDVKDEIKQELAETRAVQEITDQLDVIEDARAGGSSLDEIARNYGLTLVTYPAIDARGNDGNGDPIADLPAGNELVSAVFESDIGLENNAIPLDVGYVWYEVTGVDEPRDRELSEVRDRVIVAYREAEIDKRLTETAEDIRNSLGRGEAIETIAEENNTTVVEIEALTRSTPAEGDLSAAVIQAAFGGPAGHTAVADGEGQAKVVLAVTNTTVPPYFSGSPAADQTAERLSADLTNAYLLQYVRLLQDRLDVAVNQVALNLLTSPPDNAGI